MKDKRLKLYKELFGEPTSSTYSASERHRLMLELYKHYGEVWSYLKTLSTKQLKERLALLQAVELKQGETQWQEKK